MAAQAAGCLRGAHTPADVTVHSEVVEVGAAPVAPELPDVPTEYGAVDDPHAPARTSPR